MEISDRPLNRMGKRELVHSLLDAIKRWNGSAALDSDEERKILAHMDLLERCTLFVPERHWLYLCETCLAEARRKPASGLRGQWLQTMQDWLDYLGAQPFFANDPPAPPGS